MATSSNLYAEKIFAEHPLTLYPMDENIGYMSLIPESTRDISAVAWSKTSATATSALLSSAPFPSSYTSTITPGGTTSCVLQSGADIVTPPLETFAIGFYFYVGSLATATSIDFGYRISSGTAQTVNYVLTSNDVGKWVFLSKTFTSTAGVSPSGASVYIKLNYATPTGTMLINGITVGSWSEEFNSKSLGIPTGTSTYPSSPSNSIVYQLPSTINTTSSYGVISSEYSDDTLKGFYIATNTSKIFARSSSVPLVYGSQNSTILSPNSIAGQPSFIFPGSGFLNENGKYSDRTFEGWFRINAVNPNMKKIFGPLEHNDGLYANNGCLILKIDKNFISYNIDEWNKPMLIQIQISINSATLFVNGENAGSMFFNSKTTPFQDYTVGGDNADWLGVYAYDTEVPSVEIDCFAIYSYKPPIEVIKRRFIYGQGVNYPETVDFQFNGQSFVTENSVSNSVQVYNYPSIGKWKDGVVNNILPTTYYLSMPNYSLPTFTNNTYTYDEFLADLYATNVAVAEANQFIRLKPTSGTGSWSSTKSQILFNKFQMLYDNVVSFYGIFKVTTSSVDEQILLRLENSSGDDFTVSVVSTTVSYKFNGSVLTTKSITVGTSFGVGIDINALVSSTTDDALKQFFANIYQIRMFVGGFIVEDVNYTFTGNIYRVGFSNSRNHNSSNFTNGYWSNTSVASYSGSANFASYTLIAKKIVDMEILDIAISGNWQHNIPLQYFSTYLDDGSGTYTFDYLQYNIDIPESDTSNIKTYISLQSTLDGSNTFSEEYASSTAPINYLINNATLNVKYDVYDGTIIVPDASVTKQSTALVLHIDFSVNGIITNPLKVNNLKIASQLVYSGSDSQKRISSRYGLQLMPFYSSTYKPKISIYSIDNPYLYLTNKSGIQNLSGYTNQDSGYYSTIDQGTKLDYIQLTFKNNIDLGTTPLQLFKITWNDSSQTAIIFYLNNIGDRYYIEAKQGSTVIKYVKYYWNGTYTYTPTFKKNEWGTLGIVFTEFPDFASSAGKFSVVGPSLIQNFSYYGATDKQLASKYITTPWSSYSGLLWGNAAITGGTWGDLADLISLPFDPIDVSQFYSVYTGTNIILPSIDDGVASNYLKLGKYEYTTYTGIRTELKDTSIS